MHLAKSLNFLLISILCPFALLNAKDEDILSKDRLKQFKLSEEKVIEDSAKLQKDWINPITITYSKIDGEITDTEKTVISVNQPIFKSGGIYSAILYAKANKIYSNLDINLQRKEMIRKAYNLLFNIHKTNLEIKKSELILKNAQIDIVRKKEQVLNGFLDTSYLDNAILDANTAKKNLADLKYQKKAFINNFNNIASNDYKIFKLPEFNIVSKKQFISNNLEILKSQADIETKKQLKTMTISQYLPTISATYDFTRNHSNSANIVEKEVQNVGISISMPIDVRTFNDIESSQINYLKSKLSLKTQKLEEENFFRTQMQKIETIEEKIKITKDDYKLYSSLLNTIVEEKNAGLKTKSDVDTLLNSSKVKEVELKIFKIDKQLELLELYAKLKK
ncbi:hypothetical protein CPU12_08455 [Malaciobacter molluscorum LMG 25693]|uniref:RND family efflux system, outer membrane channel protein, TolC family n=1 Tax=Malaciobacter molluscorum LMG 25693 TaxID=870501 RepID=A0A2G1DH14_9BACT|nr:TolC family protein [Malaciobacter molluscorum]AXX93376.1 RND family efflux system, outer membrane channel protein, TolC family [Malaciobacter molluscorum LMG 25693]PHO17781.1 hypothetical protein CPU12_08455 [Malaciobacter molluscorum LMG 25693]